MIHFAVDSAFSTLSTKAFAASYPSWYIFTSTVESGGLAISDNKALLKLTIETSFGTTNPF